jgi:hypothetical protein
MSLIQDLRYSLRRLRNSPGFTATAVLTLALGMGATTAVYSVIQAVLLNTLPIADAARLYIVRESTKGGPMSVAWPNFQDWSAQQHSFEPLAACSGKGFQFFDGVRTTRTGGLEVSANFFSVTRARPLLGRFFTEAEDRPARRYQDNRYCDQSERQAVHGNWRDSAGLPLLAQPTRRRLRSHWTGCS